MKRGSFRCSGGWKRGSDERIKVTNEKEEDFVQVKSGVADGGGENSVREEGEK